MKKLIIGIVLALVLAVTAVPVVSASGQKPLDHVVVTPIIATILPGGTQQFSATAQDTDNETIVGVTYTWGVVAGGGTIDGIGLFTAGITPGTFTNTIQVTAFKGGITETAYATVIVAIPGLLDHVVISPDAATVQPSDTQQFSATAQDAFNQAVAGVTYGWEVVASGGIIDGTGLFTAGVTPGTFTNNIKVTATQTSIIKTDTATVKVAVPGVLDYVVISPDTATVPVGGIQQFNATGKDAFNQTVVGVTYGWEVVSGVGIIDSTGKFTAGSELGTSTVRVTANQTNISKIDTAVVTVAAESEEHEFRVPPGWSKGKKTGWNGGDTPPGWAKGKKTGWDGEDSPPGLSK